VVAPAAPARRGFGGFGASASNPGERSGGVAKGD
ncbi:MAG: hypothetical protein JWQ92_1719, partial [Amnibacterium sp.]|nr:hypothetical protein [Amnibacterium sp.]